MYACRSKLRSGQVLDAARAVVLGKARPSAKMLNELNAAALGRSEEPTMFASVYRCCDSLAMQEEPAAL